MVGHRDLIQKVDSSPFLLDCAHDLLKERTIITQLLLAGGADINQRDTEGNTLLHIAALKLLTDQARVYIEKGLGGRQRLIFLN